MSVDSVVSSMIGLAFRYSALYSVVSLAIQL